MAAAVKKRDSRLIHQDLNSFVDFKREMVRLDYAAANLRKAGQRVENEKERQREELRQAVRDVEERSKSLERRLLQDDQETLELEKSARIKSEQRRLLEAEVMKAKQKVEELARKQSKLKLAVSSLEQHRVFLNDIIAHKVSPRTPASSRRILESESVSDMVQSPGMVKGRLAQKERNVLSQSELVYQATDLVCRFPLEVTLSGRDSRSPKALAATSQGAEPKLNFSLNEEVFAIIYRLYKRFISSKCCHYDPLGNFAAIERYAYYLLDLVDSCDVAMLRKIISKIVKDKKKLLEAQLQERNEAKRRQREEIALARATSAPAQFRRPVINRKLFGQRKQAQAFKEEIITRHREDLSYLFRLQQE